jgi:hypothetical protein
MTPVPTVTAVTAGCEPECTTTTTVGAVQALEEPLYSPISFPIPLAEGLDTAHAIYNKVGYVGTPLTEEEKEGKTAEEIDAIEAQRARCPGTSVDPLADAGYLCVYAAKQVGLLAAAVTKPTSPTGVAGADRSGALVAGVLWKSRSQAFGTWAVTAP